MAAPTFVSFGASAWNTSTSPKTVSVTVQTGDRIVVMSLGENANSGASNTAPTGGGETYMQVVSLGTDGSSGRVIAWTATATSAQTFSVSAVRPMVSVNEYWGVCVWVWRDSDGFGAVGAPTAGSTSNSVTWTTTGANSAACVGSVDWNATDGTTRTRRTINSSTGTEDAYFRDASRATWFVQRYADVGAAGSKTAGYSAPAGQASTIGVVEVLGTAGGTDKAGSDSGTESEASTIAASASRTDAASLAETIGGTAVGSAADSAGATESVSATAATGAVDSAALGETASVTGDSTETFHFPSGKGWAVGAGSTDTTPLNLGTVFALTEPAGISGVRFYCPGGTTTFTAQLWADGVKVAETSGVSATADGWTEALFVTPVSGATGVDYIASVLQSSGTSRYTLQPLSFSDGPNPVLVEVGPARSNIRENGLYTYGTGVPATADSAVGPWYGVDAILEGVSDPTAPGGSDTGSLTDSAALSVAVAASDSWALTDAAGISLNRSVADSVTLSEAALPAAAVSDVLVLAEASSLSSVLAGSDAGALTDSASLSSGSNQSASDSAALTDTPALAATVARVDTTTLTDTAFVSIPKTGTDTGTLSEQNETLITDTDPDGTLSESLTLTSAIFRTDTAGLTDTASVSAAGNPAATDSGAVSDTAALAVSHTRTDSGALADSSTLSAGGNPAVTDTGALAEAAVIVVVVTASDAATAGDTAGLFASFTRADSGSLADTGSVSAGGVTVIGSDSGTLAETITLTVTASAVDLGALAELALAGATMARSDAAALAEVGAIYAVGPRRDYRIVSGTPTLGPSGRTR